MNSHETEGEFILGCQVFMVAAVIIALLVGWVKLSHWLGN